jgi:hypothetical protein
VAEVEVRATPAGADAPAGRIEDAGKPDPAVAREREGTARAARPIK